MSQRTGAQLKSDMGSVETAIDTVIATPTLTNAQALVTTCASVIANCRDSRKSVAESATNGVQSPSNPNGYPAPIIAKLVDAVREEALFIQQTGATTEAIRWKQLKTTYCGLAWDSYKGRKTAD